MAPSKRMTSPLIMGFSTMCSCQQPIFSRLTQSRRKRNLGTQRLADRFRKLSEHGGIKNARCNGGHADPVLRQFPGDGQCHTDDATF